MRYQNNQRTSPRSLSRWSYLEGVLVTATLHENAYDDVSDVLRSINSVVQDSNGIHE